MTAAKSIAGAGAVAVDLIARSQPRTATEVAATIRAAAEIADPAVLPSLRRFAGDERAPVRRELVRAWRRFDVAEYAERVLAGTPFDGGRLEIDDPALIAGLPHLTRLEDLYCGYQQSSFGLAFMAGLPRLVHLATQDRSVIDLSPLAGTGIRSFNAYSGHPDAQATRDLSPLSEARELESLGLWTGPVANVSALGRCRRLSRLRLEALGDPDFLDDLAELTDLEFLGIGAMDALTDLTPLHFLRAPQGLGITGCPVDENLHQLARWKDTLTELSLRDLRNADLGRIASLTRLNFLDIQGSQVHNLVALAGLGSLERLWCSAMLTDLGHLTEFRALREVIMTGPIPPDGLDLTPLAAMSGVDVHITVPRSAKVTVPANGGPRIVRNHF
jgi:hypothetical protein